jgi:hypothetical protein
MEAERIKCLSPTATDNRRLEAVDCEAVVRVGIDTVVAAGARIWGDSLTRSPSPHRLSPPICPSSAADTRCACMKRFAKGEQSALALQPTDRTEVRVAEECPSASTSARGETTSWAFVFESALFHGLAAKYPTGSTHRSNHNAPPPSFSVSLVLARRAVAAAA